MLDQKPITERLRDEANVRLTARDSDVGKLFEFAKKQLEPALLFGPAAKIYARTREKDDGRDRRLSNRIRQREALCTYKDEEAPIARRLLHALALLEAIPPLVEEPPNIGKPDALADAIETTALKGAVHKRLWL